MKVKLNIPERYTLIQVVPRQGSFDTMSIIESLSKKLYPSEEEIKKFGIEVKGDKIAWNDKATEEIEIELTEGEKDLILLQLNEKSEDKKLDFNQYLLYKKLS